MGAAASAEWSEGMEYQGKALKLKLSIIFNIHIYLYHIGFVGVPEGICTDCSVCKDYTNCTTLSHRMCQAEIITAICRQLMRQDCLKLEGEKTTADCWAEFWTVKRFIYKPRLYCLMEGLNRKNH